VFLGAKSAFALRMKELTEILAVICLAGLLPALAKKARFHSWIRAGVMSASFTE